MKIRPQVGKNDKLREHLSQVVQEETGTKMSHGKVNLEAIYDDGFHICPDFYGQRRDNNEAFVASVQNCCTEIKHTQVQKSFKGQSS